MQTERWTRISNPENDASSITKRIAELEEEKNELLQLFKKWGIPLHTQPDPTKKDQTEAFNKLHYVNAELNLAQQKYLALLLSSVYKSSNTLEELTKKLNKLTKWLLVLTFLLAWVAVGDYIFTFIFHLK